MNTFPPIIALGKTNETAASGTYSDGATTYNFGSHPFSVDDRMFANDGASLNTYIGIVTATTATSVTTDVQLSGGFSADTLTLWSATTSFRPDWGLDVWSPNRDIDYGKTFRKTIGGGDISTGLRAKTETVRFRIGRFPKSQAPEWDAVMTAINDGLDYVTIGYYESATDQAQVAQAKIIMPPAVIATENNGEILSLGVDFFVGTNKKGVYI